MINNYTVTLNVREVRFLAIELKDVIATSESNAIRNASSQYDRTGRDEFTVELTDGGADEVLGSTVELTKEDENEDDQYPLGGPSPVNDLGY